MRLCLDSFVPPLDRITPGTAKWVGELGFEVIGVDLEPAVSTDIAACGRIREILEAEGFSVGLQRIYETASQVDSNTMGLQYLEMMKRLGEGQSTKWIIPMDLASMAATLTGSLAGVVSASDGG